MDQPTNPVQAVTHPDPYPYYADLVARRPFGFDEELGLWVAADAAAVTAVLEAPTLRVRPPRQPVPPGIVDTPAGDVFGAMVRMLDGPPHQRLKDLVVRALAGVDAGRVAALTAERAAADARAGRLDELMFAVPARVVAGLCGLDEGAGARAARLIGDFVRCLPGSAGPDDHAAAAVAADQLREVMGPALDGPADGLLAVLVRAAGRHDWPDTAVLLANAVGFLSQTYDATAGLIGNTLLRLARDPALSSEPPARLVAEVARHDSPVHNTRRLSVEPFDHDGVRVPPGQAILALVAAANRDPAANPDPHEFRTDRDKPVMFTFGAGPHGCPGETLAVTIAATVVGELRSAGHDPACLPAEVAYRPLPNVRIPVLAGSGR